jgi:PKHD-type hydroxylase
MSEYNMEDALISAKDQPLGQHNPDLNVTIRNSHIAFVRPNEKTAWIFERLNFIIDNLNSRFYNYDLNGYSFLQYGEYLGNELGKYDWHMDAYFGPHPEGFTEPRKLSITVLLNDPDTDYEGGNFEINKGRFTDVDVVPLKKGTLIAFPSYVIHRVAPVTKGIRKSLVIWVQGPKFR